MCHFALSAEELELRTEFCLCDPKISGGGVEYIGSYIVK